MPANCSFEIEDFEDEWNYSQRFDLIHARLMVSCFQSTGPKRLFEQALKFLAPGYVLILPEKLSALLTMAL